MKIRNDFTVSEYIPQCEPTKIKWQIRCGGSLISIFNNEQIAHDTAKNLNIDPWFLERGQTQKDRAKSYIY